MNGKIQLKIVGIFRQLNADTGGVDGGEHNFFLRRNECADHRGPNPERSIQGRGDSRHDAARQRKNQNQSVCNSVHASQTPGHPLESILIEDADVALDPWKLKSWSQIQKDIKSLRDSAAFALAAAAEAERDTLRQALQGVSIDLAAAGFSASAGYRSQRPELSRPISVSTLRLLILARTILHC
ncbi:hypothetical protein ACQ5SK_26725 [Bradyrhizobium japonicum]